MSYLTPGVYIQELGSLPASIAPLPTGIPAFLGVTEKQPEAAAGFHRIHSLREYENIFGFAPISDKPAQGLIPDVGFLHGSVALFYANGGAAAYVYSVGTSTSSMTQQAFIDGFDVLKNVREPALVLFPDAVGLADGLARVQRKALEHCAEIGNRFCILDVPARDTLLHGVDAFRSSLGIDHLQNGAVYGPWLQVCTASEKQAEITAKKNALENAMRLYQEQVAISGPESPAVKALTEQVQAARRLLDTTEPHELPASGAVAGVFAAVDVTRGVWKAPASIALSGVQGLTESIDESSQQSIHVSVADGKSINVIRRFVDRGILVWGARTLAGNDNEWRYVPVRRLFLMVEESIRAATATVVFEPNDANTWIKVRAMIEIFLTNLWRHGALAGVTTQQAFFVNVGLGSTMTPEDIVQGRMIIIVGLAAVRPAEFTVFRISFTVS